MILKCTCSHKDQDRLHGRGNRVCNACVDGSFRCTVCKTKHNKKGDFTYKDKK